MMETEDVRGFAGVNITLLCEKGEEEDDEEEMVGIEGVDD